VDATELVQLMTAADAESEVAIFDDVVDGTFDLSSRTVRRPVRLERVRFNGLVDLRYARFDRSVQLTDCEFSEGIDLDSAVFQTDLLLNQSLFDMRANLRDVTVLGTVSARGLRVPHWPEPLRLHRGRFSSSVVLGGTIERSVDLAGARFEGNLELLTATISGSLTLGGSSVDGSIHLRDVTVSGQSVFTGLRVGRQFGSRDVAFERDANFDYAVFGGKAAYERATFKSSSSWRFARFGLDARFDRTDFSERAEFTGASFGTDSSFRAVAFSKGAVFDGVSFESVSFGADIVDGVTVPGAEALDALSFDNARFRGRASFGGRGGPAPPPLISVTPRGERLGAAWGLRAAADVRFRDAVFDAGASFDGMRCDELDLTRARFADRLDLSNAHIDSKLILESTTAAQVRFAWPTALGTSDRRPTPSVELAAARFGRFDTSPTGGEVLGLLERFEGYDPTTLYSLESAVRASGDDLAADEVYLERRRREKAHARRDGDWSRWFGVSVYGWLARFGIRPYRLLVVSALLVVWLTLLFAEPSAMSRSAAGQTTMFSDLSWDAALGEAVDVFLPVDLPVGEAWEPTSIKVSTPVIGLDVSPALAASLVAIAGWIVVPIGIAAVTGLLRRANRLR
jgi:hypothetical protein